VCEGRRTERRRGGRREEKERKKRQRMRSKRQQRQKRTQRRDKDRESKAVRDIDLIGIRVDHHKIEQLRGDDTHCVGAILTFQAKVI
jgi:hypothetical protein